jgi:hypothetical protein
VLALIILLGTLIDIWEQANPYRELIPKKSTEAPQSMFVKILKCFSFVENGKRILNTDPPKDGSNHLGCLSGIRLVYSIKYIMEILEFEGKMILGI